jgi:hypothetical protein
MGSGTLKFPNILYSCHKRVFFIPLKSKKMWSSIWQYFAKTVSSYLHLTAFRLETDSSRMFYTENLICEGGDVVGKTAVINVKSGRVAQTAGKLPFGYITL